MATTTKKAMSIAARIKGIREAVTKLKQAAMDSAEKLVNLIWFDEDANTEALLAKTGYKSISAWFRNDPELGSSSFNAVYLGLVNKAAQHAGVKAVDSVGAAKILKANLIWEEEEDNAGQAIKEAGPEMAVSLQLHARLRAYNVLVGKKMPAIDAAKKACQMVDRGVDTTDAEAVNDAAEDGSDNGQAGSGKSDLTKCQEAMLKVRQLLIKMTPADFDTACGDELVNTAIAWKIREEGQAKIKEATTKK